MKKNNNIVACALLLCVAAGGFYNSFKKQDQLRECLYGRVVARFILYLNKQKESSLGVALMERFARVHGYETVPALDTARLDVSVPVQLDNRVLVISRLTRRHSHRLISKNRDNFDNIREDEAKDLLAKRHALQI